MSRWSKAIPTPRTPAFGCRSISRSRSWRFLSRGRGHSMRICERRRRWPPSGTCRTPPCRRSRRSRAMACCPAPGCRSRRPVTPADAPGAGCRSGRSRGECASDSRSGGDPLLQVPPLIFQGSPLCFPGEPDPAISAVSGFRVASFCPRDRRNSPSGSAPTGAVQPVNPFQWALRSANGMEKRARGGAAREGVLNGASGPDSSFLRRLPLDRHSLGVSLKVIKRLLSVVPWLVPAWFATIR